MSARQASRRARAVESFQAAAVDIGTVTPGMSLFAVTRGQWSMIDAILHARFENFDITEGGADYDLVKGIEDELPVLPDDCPGSDVYKASKVSKAFDQEKLSLFKGCKVWSK